jgi:group I intron endonuclease
MIKSVGRIYIITNNKSNHAYIGFTTKEIDKRFFEHKKMSSYNNINSNTPLYKAMREYGVENFVINELYSSNDIEHTFGKMEHHFITKYDTMFPNGYNSMPGGKHRSHQLKKNNKCV